MPVKTRSTKGNKKKHSCNKEGYKGKKVFDTFEELLNKIESKLDKWVNLKEKNLSHNIIQLIEKHIRWVPVGKPLIAHKKQKRDTHPFKQCNT